MGNFIFGAATATILSYAYVMFGWSVPAFLELPNMIGALPEKIAVIELIDDPDLTDAQRQRAVALRIRSDPGVFLAYEKATKGAFTRHVLREQGCNRVWKIIVQAKSARSAIERLKRDGDTTVRRLVERYDSDGAYLEGVREAMETDHSVRTYVGERFGTTDPARAAVAIAAAPVEFCGVDVLVELQQRR